MAYYSINKEKTLASTNKIVINPLGTEYAIGFDVNYVYEINNAISIFPIQQKEGELLGAVIKNSASNEVSIIDADKLGVCACNQSEKVELPDIFGDDDTAVVTVAQLKQILSYYSSLEQEAEKLAEYVKVETYNKALLKYKDESQINALIDAKITDMATKTELAEYSTTEAIKAEYVNNTDFGNKVDTLATKDQLSDYALKSEVTDLTQRIETLENA